jgi:hypothetical protein
MVRKQCIDNFMKKKLNFNHWPNHFTSGECFPTITVLLETMIQEVISLAFLLKFYKNVTKKCWTRSHRRSHRRSHTLKCTEKNYLLRSHMISLTIAQNCFMFVFCSFSWTSWLCRSWVMYEIIWNGTLTSNRQFLILGEDVSL